MTDQQVAEPLAADRVIHDRVIHDLVVRRLTALVAELTAADPAGTPAWRLEPVGYDANSPTTAGLYRLRMASDPPRSLFVKLLQSYRNWPLLDLVPPAFRKIALETELWRYEADVYGSGLADSLPDGLRLPQVHTIDTLDEDHALLVVEDVTTVRASWDSQRFGRAAEQLGRLNAGLTRDDVLPATADRIPGRLTKTFYEGFIATASVPALLAESVWSSPLLQHAGAGLRHDLAELADRAPALVDALGRRPQLMGHGDACPQNLLVPADRPDAFVAIDWTPSGLVAAGDDLGQLLIGHAHSGALDVDQLAGLRELVVTRYADGLAAEGCSAIDEADVRFGLDGALALRSAFLSIPLHRLAEPVTDELAGLFDQRLRLTRYLVDLGLAMPVDA